CLMRDLAAACGSAGTVIVLPPVAGCTTGAGGLALLALALLLPALDGRWAASATARRCSFGVFLATAVTSFRLSVGFLASAKSRTTGPQLAARASTSRAKSPSRRM